MCAYPSAIPPSPDPVQSEARMESTTFTRYEVPLRNALLKSSALVFRPPTPPHRQKSATPLGGSPPTATMKSRVTTILTLPNPLVPPKKNLPHPPSTPVLVLRILQVRRRMQDVGLMSRTKQSFSTPQGFVSSTPILLSFVDYYSTGNLAFLRIS